MLDFHPDQALITSLLSTLAHVSRAPDFYPHPAVVKQPSSFRVNLTKQVQNFSAEHYKHWGKGSKGDLNKWSHLLCSSVLTPNIAKMSVLSKSISGPYAILTKVLTGWFLDIDGIVLKCIWKGKETRIAQTIFENLRTKWEELVYEILRCIIYLQ